MRFLSLQGPGETADRGVDVSGARLTQEGRIHAVDFMILAGQRTLSGF